MYQAVVDYFDAFGGPKSPQWGGMIELTLSHGMSRSCGQDRPP